MSTLKEIALCDALPGLRLKRRCGDTVVIEHRGEEITVQVIAFKSGYQVVLGFYTISEEFQIVRGELLVDADERTPS